MSTTRWRMYERFAGTIDTAHLYKTDRRFDPGLINRSSKRQQRIPAVLVGDVHEHRASGQMHITNDLGGIDLPEMQKLPADKQLHPCLAQAADELEIGICYAVLLLVALIIQNSAHRDAVKDLA